MHNNETEALAATARKLRASGKSIKGIAKAIHKREQFVKQAIGAEAPKNKKIVVKKPIAKPAAKPTPKKTSCKPDSKHKACKDKPTHNEASGYCTERIIVKKVVLADDLARRVLSEILKVFEKFFG